MPEQADTIETLLQTYEDELLLILGRQISARYAFPPSKQQLREVAEEWFTSHLMDFQETICGNHRVLKLRNNNNLIELAAAIADLIVGICTGVSPVTVAVLIIKYGISKLCQNGEDTKL
jgi:hypothetical protein